MKSILDYIDSRPAEAAKGYTTAPTGSGKTVIFATVMEQLRQQGKLPRTFIAVPTKQLVPQTRDEIIDKGFQGSVRLLTSAGHRRDDGLGDAVISTYAMLARHTTNKTATGLWTINPAMYGMLILDEAHHLQGEASQKSLQQHFQHAIQLGFTATPDYDDERQLKAILPDHIFDISTSEAVDEGLIAPYVTALLATPGDLSQVKINGQEYDQKSLETAINTEVRNRLIAKFAAEALVGKKLMFNTGSVMHAEALASALRDAGVSALAVSGFQTPNQVNKITTAFHEKEISAIVQAKLLGEGYNEEAIDVVINVRPTLSFVRQKQRTGRGQRIDPNNPDKVLLVIECTDSNYRRKPVLYGHEKVTGHWTYAPQGLPESFKAFLTHAQQYADGVSRFITDESEIQTWYNTRNDLFGTRTPQPIVVSASGAPGLPESDPALKLIPVRRPRAKRVAPETLEDLRNREQHQLALRRLAESETENSAEPQTSITSPIDRLHPLERSLANFVLYGTSLESGINKQTVRAALRYLAGSDELEDPEVLGRFQKLNQFLLDVATQTATEDKQQQVEEAEELEESQDQEQETEATHSEEPKKTRAKGNYILNGKPAFRSLGRNCMGLDPEMFFPLRGESTREAKEICRACEVREGCLEHALANGEKFGIWGGTSERERRRIRKARAKTAKAQQDEQQAQEAATAVTPGKLSDSVSLADDAEDEEVYQPSAEDVAEAEALFTKA